MIPVRLITIIIAAYWKRGCMIMFILGVWWRTCKCILKNHCSGNSTPVQRRPQLPKVQEI